MIDEKKLEERLVALEAAKSWSPRVVSRLEMLLRSGTDEELYRINPIQFAIEKSIAEAEAIDLFLHACVAGLFDMDWMLVCPMCSDVVESFRSLRKLHTHFRREHGHPRRPRQSQHPQAQERSLAQAPSERSFPLHTDAGLLAQSG
jgi:hypothetical protein